MLRVEYRHFSHFYRRDASGQGTQPARFPLSCRGVDDLQTLHLHGALPVAYPYVSKALSVFTKAFTASLTQNVSHELVWITIILGLMWKNTTMPTSML